MNQPSEYASARFPASPPCFIHIPPPPPLPQQPASLSSRLCGGLNGGRNRQDRSLAEQLIAASHTSIPIYISTYRCRGPNQLLFLLLRRPRPLLLLSRCPNQLLLLSRGPNQVLFLILRRPRLSPSQSMSKSAPLSSSFSSSSFFLLLLFFRSVCGSDRLCGGYARAIL